jgi:hypothetical protein
MWTLRSAAHHVAPAVICLISTLIVGGARAQTAADASDSKPVQVLQIREASGTNEGAAKKSKATVTPAKKKVARRKTTKAAANEGADAPVQSAMAAVAAPTAAQNDTPMPSTEQTGTLAVGDHAVALASSPGEDNNVGLSLANSVGTKEDPSASAIAVGNPPRAISDTEQAPGTRMAEQMAPSSKNSPLSQSLATLSGAVLAVAFGWYLVGSSRRRISLGVDPWLREESSTSGAS